MKLRLLIVLLLASCPLLAQCPSGFICVDGLQIPNSHPRLWFNATTLAQAKSWYASHPFTPSGDGTSVQYIATALRGLLTGSSSDCSSAKNWAVGFTSGGFDTTPSDVYRNNAEGVSLIFDWCYSSFSSSDKSTLLNVWNTEGSAQINQNYGVYNNYFWGEFRGFFTWGVATLGDNSSAQGFIDNIMAPGKYWDTWKSAAGATPAGGFTVSAKGGVPAEGAGYGRYHVWYPMTPLLSASNLGRNLFNETNYYIESLFNIIYSGTLAPTPSMSVTGGGNYYQSQFFNDDQYHQDIGDFTYMDTMTMYANQYAGTSAGQYARAWLNMMGAGESGSLTGRSYQVQATDTVGSSLALSSLPLDYFSPGTGFMYSRNSWNPTATMVQFYGGYACQANCGHWHGDVGSFSIWRNGQWLSALDPSYNDTVQGYNNSGQTPADWGPAQQSVYYQYIGPARNYTYGPYVNVTRVQSDPNFAFEAADISGPMHADPKQDTPGRDDDPYAGTTVREYLYIKPLETLVLFDRMQAVWNPQPGDSTHPQLSPSAVVRGLTVHCPVSPTLAGTKMVCSPGGSQALETNIVYPASGVAARIITENGTSPSTRRFRLEAEANGAAQMYFVTALQARGTSAASLTLSAIDNGSTITLNLVHPTAGCAQVIYIKGASSTGGLFGYTSNAGCSAPTASQALLASVQPETVSTSGVVWSGSANSPPLSACDLNGDGVVNNLDYQIAMNQALGITSCTNGDLVGTGTCSVVDVQRVANAMPPGTCRTGQ